MEIHTFLVITPDFLLGMFWDRRWDETKEGGACCTLWIFSDDIRPAAGHRNWLIRGLLHVGNIYNHAIRRRRVFSQPLFQVGNIHSWLNHRNYFIFSMAILHSYVLWPVEDHHRCIRPIANHDASQVSFVAHLQYILIRLISYSILNLMYISGFGVVLHIAIYLIFMNITSENQLRRATDANKFSYRLL